VAKDVTLLIKLQDAVSGKVRAIAGASKKAEAAIQKLQRAVEGVGRKFDRLKSKASAGLSAIAAKAKNAAKSFGGFGKAAAIAAAAAGALAGLRFAFTQAGELEKATRSLKVLTGSLDDAKRIIGELQAFGAVTPFTSAELIDTAKRLKAFGFETEKIVDVTKRLADVAGATGADLGGIATAFGQIQAKGRLQGEELLQLQERGINLQDELQKMYGMTGDEFRKALEKGRFSAEAVNLALVKLTSTGGKYAEGAIAQSDTLFGKLSTLQDAFIRLGQNIGKALAPIFKFLIDQTTRLVNAINDIFARNAAINAVRQRQKDKGMSGRTLGRFMGSEEGRAAVEAELAKQRAAGGGTTGTGLPDPNAQPPALLGGTGGTGGSAADKQANALKQQQESAADLITSLTRQIELTNELTDAGDRKLQLEHDIADIQKQFPDLKDEERQKLINLTKQLHLAEEGEIARAAAADQAREAAEAARKAQEEDPLFQMQKKFDELIKLENQVAAGATAIGNAFSNAFTSVISGSKSAQEALADMMASVAEHFLDMAAQIIAQQIAMIIYGTIMKALGVGLPSMESGQAGVGQMADMGGIGMGGAGTVQNKMGQGFGTLGPNFGIRQYAEGGYASVPTRALVGEGGEGEYLIPESKMRESMARYSRGARGSSVIPENGAGGTNSEGSGTAVAAPIDVRYTVERINSVDYVTADQFQAGMRQAASQGAKQGEQQTLKRLQMSSSTRKRLGM
jgi:tape measure domain-containing protein